MRTRAQASKASAARSSTVLPPSSRKGLRAEPLARLRARKALARGERRQGDEERMDELLEQIHREGIGSLTRSERSFLERVSSRT